MDGVILKDDARYHHTEAYLQEKGHTFHSPGSSPRGLDFTIFPFKEKVDEVIYNDEYFTQLGKTAHIFSGVRSGYLTEKCAMYGLCYHVMMEDKGTTVKNAVPTSEGVIAYLIHNLQRTIANSRILVIGYGVCGRDLSLRLAALGSSVSALVRNREKECTAQADSVTPIYFSEPALSGFDAIINTVPAQVISDEALRHTDGALLIDIASAPYGFDMEIAKKLNSCSALLPGIPGKYAVQTAGETLGEYVEFILRR